MQAVIELERQVATMISTSRGLLGTLQGIIDLDTEVPHKGAF